VTEQLQIPKPRDSTICQLDQVLSESALFEVDRTPGTSRSHRHRRYLLDISGFVLEVSSNWSGCTASRCIDEPALRGWLKGLSRHCDRSSAIANLPKLEAIRLLTGSELESKDLEQFCRKSTKSERQAMKQKISKISMNSHRYSRAFSSTVCTLPNWDCISSSLAILCVAISTLSLLSAWQQVAARHTILRTSFYWKLINHYKLCIGK